MLSPLTLDHDPLLRLVTDASKIQFTGGTAIGLATADGINLLIDSAREEPDRRVADGRGEQRRRHEPIQAARLRRAVGVRLYTIGVRDRSRITWMRRTLEKMAELGGGTYSRAENQQALEQSYERIGELEKSRVTRNRSSSGMTRPRVPGAAAVALALEVLLRSTVCRRIP